jgi:fumarylacetoacetate (FAA) hydrolase family protein
MGSRDIEGENLLTLLKALVYTGSSALGPCFPIGSEDLPVTNPECL